MSVLPPLKFTSPPQAATPALVVMGQGYNVPGAVPNHLMQITPDQAGYASLFSFTGYGADVDSDPLRGAPQPRTAVYTGSYGVLARAGQP